MSIYVERVKCSGVGSGLKKVTILTDVIISVRAYDLQSPHR